LIRPSEPADFELNEVGRKKTVQKNKKNNMSVGKHVDRYGRGEAKTPQLGGNQKCQK